MQQRRLNPWVIYQALVLLAVFSYANQLIYRYAVPAGGDAINHVAIVETILSGNLALIWQYHSVWHLMTIALMWLFRAPAATTMAWMAPGILVTMGLTLYLYNNRAYGTIAGLGALFLIGFFSYQPLQTLYDGGFPNVLAAGTVLPLTLIVLDSCFSAQKKWPWFIALGAILFILAFSHHITFLYALPILAAFLILATAYSVRRRGVSWLKVIGVTLGITILVLALSVFILTNPHIGFSAKTLFADFARLDWQFPFLHFTGQLADPNAIWKLSIYPSQIGPLLFYTGAVGFLIALWIVFRHPEHRAWRQSLILILWTLILLIGSRITSLGFPVRLARDMAIPLALLGGLFIQTVIVTIQDAKLVQKRTWIGTVLILFFLIVLLIGGFSTLKGRIERATQPNNLVYHLRVDSSAASYITSKVPLGSSILVFEDDHYLNEFTPLHSVIWVDDPVIVSQLSNLQFAATPFASADYVYLEYRTDRSEGPLNNKDIITRYSQSNAVSLVAKFEQPEKQTYLFKILH